MSSELEQLRIRKDQKAPRHERALWPWILLLLLLGGAGVAAWLWRSSSGEVEVETIKVRMQEGARTDQMVALSANGYVMAGHKIELASKVSGRVAWVKVEMGDKVEKDQVLVRLEDDEYKARVQQQQGQLDSAKARLAELKAGARVEEIAQAKAMLDKAMIEAENAQRAYKRAQQMHASGATSQGEIDDAEAAVRSADANVESVRQQYELIKAGTRKEQIAAQEATVHQLEGSLAMMTVDLDNTVIKAPLTSTVLERNIEVGEFVTNGFVGDRGAKGYVVSLADLNDLLVELDINQDDFAKVQANQPCLIVTDAYRDKKYNGVVERISPLANRQKASVLVRVRVLNPDGLLKPDMNATVSFLSQQSTTGPSGEGSRGAILIPTGSIRDGAVFVVESGKAVKRSVTKGMSGTSSEIEITKGLIGGEDLIVSPPADLKDGDSVKIKK